MTRRWTLRDVRRQLHRHVRRHGPPCVRLFGCLPHTAKTSSCGFQRVVAMGDVTRLPIEVAAETEALFEGSPADALAEIDRWIGRLGPDYPQREARPKGTAETQPDAQPETETAHGGDGASGETDTEAPSAEPGGDSPGGEDGSSSSPGPAQGVGSSPGSAAGAANDSTSDGSSQGCSGGSQTTASTGGADTAPTTVGSGAADAGGSASEDAEARASGDTSARPADAEREGGGTTRGDRAAQATATASGPARGDTPGESPDVPRPRVQTGERGKSAEQRETGEGTSPGLTSEPPEGSGTASGPRSTGNRESGPVRRLREELLRLASETENKRQRRQLRKWAYRLDRPVTLSLLACATGFRIRGGRSSWIEDSTVRQAVREAIYEAEQSQGAGPAGGRTGGSLSHLDAAEARRAARQLRRSRTCRRLMRALERWLDRDVGAVGDPTPRLDARRLVAELTARSVRLSRCRRREHEQSTAILAVDTSGSCSVYCHDTMSAALSLALRDDRLVVVEHTNGLPYRLIRGASAHYFDVDRRDAGSLAAYWQRLCRDHRTTSVIWLGDGDGFEVRRALGDLRLVMLDNYSASVGPRSAPKRHREPWAGAHVVGVSDARSMLTALWLAR